MNWTSAITQELARGEAARQRGNEGMARVCARRAAGWAVQAYLGQRGVDLNTTSVLEHFRHLQNDAATEAGLHTQPELRTLLEHLLQPKLRPDLEEDSYFPEGIDLLADARRLIALLFPGGL